VFLFHFLKKTKASQGERGGKESVATKQASLVAGKVESFVFLLLLDVVPRNKPK
jgi:hypothetical protein